MSVAAYGYVMTITCHIPSHIAQMILAHLANHADRFGRHAFPSVPTIARNVRCSDRTVQRHLRWLEQHGFIRRSKDKSRVSRIPMHKRPVVYELSLSEHTRAAFAEEYRGRKTTTQPMNPLTTEAVTGIPGDTGYAGAVTTKSPKPSCEPTLMSPNGDISPATHNRHRRAFTSQLNDDAVKLIDEFMHMLDDQGIKAKRLRPYDRKAAIRLVDAHGLQKVLELAQWVSSDGFWCGKMLNLRSLERRWEEFRLARRHERFKRQQPHGDGFPSKNATAGKPVPDSTVLVSSATIARCPVYGYRTFPSGNADRTGEAQRHLDGAIPGKDCPVCAHDARNRSLHGGGNGLEEPESRKLYGNPVPSIPPMTRMEGRWS